MNTRSELIKNLIIDAGEIITREIISNGKITKKSTANFVTSVDYMVQNFIVEKLSIVEPDSQIISEELENNLNFSTKPTWIVDPIDGTTNYIHGLPNVAISLAFSSEKKIMLGAVHNPFSGELFFAERGKGAFLNNKRIHVSRNKNLSDSLIGFGIPYDRKKAGRMFSIAEAVFATCQDVKRQGPASLDISNVACGRMDGFFEADLRPWDYAAGMLILSEAGGMMTDWSGQKVEVSNPYSNVLASNGAVHAKLLKIVSEKMTAAYNLGASRMARESLRELPPETR